ncbi:MAG: hypothetical protein Kow0068_23090 [Marinilabiliales bacterium]
MTEYSDKIIENLSELLYANLNDEDFRTALSSNPEFNNFDKEELVWLKNHINDYDLIDLLDKLRLFKNKRKPSKINLKIFYKVAAVIVVLAISLVLYWQFSSSTDLKTIFKENYSFCPSDFVVRGTEDADLLKNEASRYYNNHDFSKAIIIFEDVIKENPSDHYAILYCGLSYLERGISDESLYNSNYYISVAITNFKKIVNSGDKLYYDQAIWYMALSYIYIGEVDQALLYLDKLAECDSTLSDKARDIIDKIK